MKLKHRITLYITILLYPCLVFSKSPSFDCSRAETKIENVICNRSHLSKLDYNMSYKYKELLSLIGEKEREPVVGSQRDWLILRNDLCGDMESESTINICLVGLYIDRIKELDNLKQLYAPSEYQYKVDGRPTIFPDEWFFEFEVDGVVNNGACRKFIRTENNDILILKSRENGHLLFANKEYEISHDEYKKLCDDNALIDELLDDNDLKINPSTSIGLRGCRSAKCYDDNCSVIFFEKEGMTNEFYLIRFFKEPRKVSYNPYCEGTDGIKNDYIIEKYEAPTLNLINLYDGTFLLIIYWEENSSYKGGYIVRFDSNFETKADIFNKNELYLFNSKKVIANIFREAKKRGVKFNTQVLIDGIEDFVKNMRMNGEK